MRAKEIVERYADRKKPFLSSFLEGRVVDKEEFSKSKATKPQYNYAVDNDLSKEIEKQRKE